MAKKRVKMLQSMAAADWSYQPQQIVEVEPEVAEAWVQAGIASLVEDEPKRTKKGKE